MQWKAADEITELKKVQDRLIFEKAVKQAVDEAYQCIYESKMELTIVAKAKRLGEVISQLQLTNNTKEIEPKI